MARSAEGSFINNALSGYIQRHKDIIRASSIHNPAVDELSKGDSFKLEERHNVTYGGTSRSLNQAKDIFGRVNGGTLQSCL
jgi:hypothetical protein